MTTALYLALSLLAYEALIYNLECQMNKKKIYYLGTLVIYFLLLISFEIVEWLSNITLLLTHIILLTYFNKNIIRSMIISVVTMLLLIIINTILIYPYLWLMHYSNVEILKADGTIYFIANLSFVVVSYAIGYMLRKVIKRIRSHLIVIQNHLYQSVLIIISVLIFMITFLMLFFADLDDVSIFVSIVVYFGLFVIFIILMLLIYIAGVNEKKVTLKQSELMQLQTYTENLEYIYSDMRRIRHDYTNVLASIIGYIEADNMNGLRGYFNHEVIPFSDEMKAFDSKLHILSNLCQPELKGLVAIKVIKALELGIAVDIDINEPFKAMCMSTIDFCRCIGILLDNAIEAASELECGSIQIGFITLESSQVIVISNTYKYKIENIAALFTKGYSSKGSGRGLGLSNVKEILSKYECCRIETDIRNQIFKQVLKFSKETI